MIYRAKMSREACSMLLGTSYYAFQGIDSDCDSSMS
jgi:hypothetical protein